MVQNKFKKILLNQRSNEYLEFIDYYKKDIEYDCEILRIDPNIGEIYLELFETLLRIKPDKKRYLVIISIINELQGMNDLLKNG